MALQLNKISRNLLQNKRLLINTTVGLLHHQAEAVTGTAAAAAAAAVTQQQAALELSRGFATKSGGRPCKLSRCPKFFLEGCACPKPCAKKKRVACKKRLAPYPSYSEACVEELDEDPSECVQCPWKHCPNFAPKWRGYHTQSTRSMPGPSLPPPPPAPTSVQDVLSEIHMYEKKPPCKKPMGQCEHRRRYLEQLRKDKEREECEQRKKQRKCTTWTESVADYYMKKDRDANVDECDTYEVFDYDPREADYEHKRKRAPQRTKCCPPKEAALAEINMQLESGYSKCPKRKPRYPDVDYTMNSEAADVPRDCPRRSRNSNCCGTRQKPRKYKKKPQTKPTYFAPLPPPPAPGAAVAAPDQPSSVPIAELAKLPNCDGTNPPCPRPCTGKPCVHRRAPWNYEHNKQRRRDGSRVRRRRRDMNTGMYNHDLILPNKERNNQD